MPQNFHLVSLKILEFYRRKIFNQWVLYFLVNQLRLF